MTTSTDIEEFLEGPLVSWVRSCLDHPDALADYEDLTDGQLIHQVVLLIDPEPPHHGVGPSLGSPALRTHNMDCIIKNIKTLYEEELGQLVVILPDPVRLGKEPESKEGLQDMQLLLLLLLGCAVQCPNKQTFIEKIKSLPIDAQHSLVECIKEVTESQEIVINPEGCETVSNDLLLGHIRLLVRQRDTLQQLAATNPQDERKHASAVAVESQHLAVELAEWKAKSRRSRQELEEKSESLAETREELELSRSLVSKLEKEISEIKTEARACKAYRDEVDALREKAEKCERLESEVQKYRDRLADLEYYRVRVDELREDNRVLEETREMLEEQLSQSKSRVQYTIQLEADIQKQKQTINELSLEREAQSEKLNDLFEENAQLTLLSKAAFNQDNSSSDNDQMDDTSTGDNSLSEQLSSNAQARALRLELENRRLASTLDNLQEAALHSTNERILELEKGKKKLSLQVEELEETKRKLTAHISELEVTVKTAQRDTKKMHDIRESFQGQLQSRKDEIETLSRDKQKLELRLAEAEQSLIKAQEREEQLEELSDVKVKCLSLEKELGRLKQSLEAKSITLDRIHNEVEDVTKEKKQIAIQLGEAKAQIMKFQDVEKELRDVESKYSVDKATLAALQKDLVVEKLNLQQLKNSLDKLGISAEQIVESDNALDRIVSNPEVLKAVRERLAEEEEVKAGDELAAINAQLEVDVKTLQSQITSLTSQLTASQLANSQLATEKEEFVKEVESLKKDHHQILVDQLTLQELHEQLTTQYDTLSKERDGLKAQIKESRMEVRGLKESAEKLSGTVATLQQEKDHFKAETLSLNNLRAEHSKLKEDFRNLFTANEKVKAEYRSSQEEFRNMRSEARKLNVSTVKYQEELALKEEKITQLEITLSKLHTQHDMLKQVKANLEEDRRALMDHVTLLLGQYHELLTHSLEDKEQHHIEEKMYTDKVNNLCRQKEKLEEKIMEHYKRLESCSTKKKGFGASVVRKIRKAGSELINKSRKSWHEEAVRRGTDSDTSLEDVRTRQDGLGLGTPGTRRTVYLSGDENSASTNDPDESKVATDAPRSSTPQQDPTALVYNRSALGPSSGNSLTPPHSPSLSHRSDHTPSRQPGSSSKSKSDIWYEYGCV